MRMSKHSCMSILLAIKEALLTYNIDESQNITERGLTENSTSAIPFT